MADVERLMAGIALQCSVKDVLAIFSCGSVAVRQAMQWIVGAFLGLVIARIILPMLLGPVGMMYFTFGVVGVVLVFFALYLWGILKMRRFARKACDNALFYARKQRKVDNEPDFQEEELRDVRLARKRGDFQTVYSIIASANKRLLDEKARNARLTFAQAQAQREAELRRPDEIRMYRG